ncbi:MAG: ankyrin repeat domain-containing protein [Salinimicrobium sediminis]|uniref:Uncharacterized protein n=1 Tax=Salinimicrobium sediminis TaxID=1343891 RepID=A0A285X6F5_9FLAO|nr:ankyrin repeat domain-containing protein [Salinimicrobium sediminis]MDX1603854.1 ankyrin repeat domain-containing protein [Salinimicrobium sediminis]MDX1751867.1 ankyrin repeat domain-containing protein [Salinimicrobium sediminis]SOC80921.1 hypothetical protein SAMN06296241_2485 [Salinimicrobium sediminis]
MEFFEAIRLGEAEEVKQQLNADPELAGRKDERGFPPLILSTYHEQPQITKLLLQQGVETDARDAAGNTALMGICFKGNKDIAEMLILNGADVNARNSSGATALIFAATFGQEEIVDLLLQNGADKTMRDSKGNTALDYAQDPATLQLLKK